MAEMAEDCPRCGTKAVTFSVIADHAIMEGTPSSYIEAFAICRICSKASIARFSTKNGAIARSGRLSEEIGVVARDYRFVDFVRISASVTREVPKHLPQDIERCFKEGVHTLAVGAYNAAAAMFRLSLDLATKERFLVVTDEEVGPNSKERKYLFDRLEYLFAKRIIAPELRDLADCVRQDGNDGAHDGTLTKVDAEDLADFAEQLLERVYTEPARLKMAKSRRDERRST